MQIKKNFKHTRPPRKKEKKNLKISHSSFTGHYCEFFLLFFFKKKKKKGERKQKFFFFPKKNFIPNLQISKNQKKI